MFVTTMDGSLLIMEGSFLSRFLLLQWMVALSLRFLILQQMVALLLWNIVCCRYFCYSIGWYPCHYERQSVVEIFVTPIDGSLVIMEGCLFASFCYSNGSLPCYYGRQYVIDIYVTLMDGSLVIMEGSMLSRILLLQWMVALSLWEVVCCQYFCYSIGRLPFHYGRQFVVQILLLQWMLAL